MDGLQVRARRSPLPVRRRRLAHPPLLRAVSDSDESSTEDEESEVDEVIGLTNAEEDSDEDSEEDSEDDSDDDGAQDDDDSEDVDGVEVRAAQLLDAVGGDTRRKGASTSSHQTANPLELAAALDPGAPGEVKPEPEPEREAGPRPRGRRDRLYRAVADM